MKDSDDRRTPDLFTGHRTGGICLPGWLHPPRSQLISAIDETGERVTSRITERQDVHGEWPRR